MVKIVYPKVDFDISEKIWLLKAFAIIAVVACHCTHTIANPSIINTFAISFFDAWKGFGVPIFYLCAGFFFTANEKFFMFMKSKAISIVLPWICTGTAIWLYVVLRKGGVSVYNWLNYLFLRESYLYFLTNLMIFYIIMYVSHKRRWLYYAISIYTIVSYVFINYIGGNVAEMLILPYEILGITFIHWFYFWIGTIIRLIKLYKFVNNSKFSLLFMVYIVISIVGKMKFEFNIYYSLINSVSAFCFIISLYNSQGIFRKLKIEHILIYVGKVSFSVYLLHMLVAGIVANILNKSEAFSLLTFVRPLVVIAITIFIIEVYKKMVGNNKYMLRLIGLRD